MVETVTDRPDGGPAAESQQERFDKDAYLAYMRKMGEAFGRKINEELMEEFIRHASQTR